MKIPVPPNLTGFGILYKITILFLRKASTIFRKHLVLTQLPDRDFNLVYKLHTNSKLLGRCNLVDDLLETVQPL